MANEPARSRTSSGASLSCSREFYSTVDTLQEPFLNFDENTELSFEDKSTIYNSLVALVKADYPFDNALQLRAVRFLKNVEPQWDAQVAAKLVTELVPSSAGSPTGFVESIVTLVSSPYSTVSDLVSKVLATVQPHTLPITGNETIFDNLVWIVFDCLDLATPSSLSKLGLIAAIDQFNHREMIFHKVVLPSSQFFIFLISNRLILKGDLLHSFMDLLTTLLEISPFHRPTLEYVLAYPIAMNFSSLLTLVEDDDPLWNTLDRINYSLEERNKEGAEVIQSGKRMTQALFSEGFEDTLEQIMKYDENGDYGHFLVNYCLNISQKLGTNMKKLI
ncbi:hypothetical protein BLNAU_23314 [Blattamonas nauphoetae]|uniref:Uncharacterized protein n=1 Tax=Blattamonas nauphoetae TaxID=2049346 RepID=A0ABQ9WQJ7_9EUKA|nr:hypothetical protein BLNAU_23314 [Blattamonas nauphoetae]